jgi:hypothetical protein
MYTKREDIRRSFTWYVVRGKEHLRMGSWEDAMELSKTSETACSVMSEQFYKQCYEKGTSHVNEP